MTRKFPVHIRWDGNLGTGTSGNAEFSRAHTIGFPGAPVPSLPGSAAPDFRGDKERYNPEQLLVASVAQCYMMTLFYLALKSGIKIVAYEDNAEGFLTLNNDGSGQISEVQLHPIVTISKDSDPDIALFLHEEVHKYCFISRSVNFPVKYQVDQRIAEE